MGYALKHEYTGLKHENTKSNLLWDNDLRLKTRIVSRFSLKEKYNNDVEALRNDYRGDFEGKNIENVNKFRDEAEVPRRTSR